MTTIKELQERKNKIAQGLRDYDRDHKATWNKEDDAAWERMNSELDAVNAAIERELAAEKRAERLRELEDEQKRVANNPGGVGRNSRDLGNKGRRDENRTRALALNAWAKGKYAREEERQAAQELGVTLADTIEINPLDSRSFAAVQEQYRERGPNAARRWIREGLAKRSLSSINSIYGGYTVPSTFTAELEVNMLAFGSVLAAGRVIQTAGGEQIGIPTFDDTGNTGSLTSENTDHGSATDPTFGKTTLSAYDYTSGVITVPNNLFADSAFDIDGLIAAALGERLARKIETDLTTGDGANKPYGIVNASTLGKTTASGTAITFEEVMDLQQSVDAAYREAGSWMMSDHILHYVRKLKDSEGRYIWVNGVANGLPDTLLGKRVYVNHAMAGVTNFAPVSATKTMLYGDFSKYLIRRAGGVRIVRMVERYAEKDQTGYLAMLRIDGTILSAGTAPIKHMLQA